MVEERFRVGLLICERHEWTDWLVMDGSRVSECDTRIPGHGSPVVRVAVPFRGEPTIEIDAEDGHVDWPIEQALRGFANERIEEAAQ